jgi:hypothetical protein
MLLRVRPLHSLQIGRFIHKQLAPEVVEGELVEQPIITQIIQLLQQAMGQLLQEVGEL